MSYVDSKTSIRKEKNISLLKYIFSPVLKKSQNYKHLKRDFIFYKISEEIKLIPKITVQIEVKEMQVFMV